jgi:hypothetical protein
MSERNGDKSRYQINRKRGVHRRAQVRKLVAEMKAAAKPAGAPKTSK